MKKQTIIIMFFTLAMINQVKSQDAAALIPHLTLINQNLVQLNASDKGRTMKETWTQKMQKKIEELMESPQMIKKLGTASKLITLTESLVCGFKEMEMYADLGYGNCYFESQIELINIRMIDVVDKAVLVMSSMRMEQSDRFTLLTESIDEYNTTINDINDLNSVLKNKYDKMTRHTKVDEELRFISGLTRRDYE